VRENPKLAKRNPKDMHPISLSIGKFDYKFILQLYEVLEVEGHLRVESLRGCSIDLDVLFVDILSNHLVQGARM